MNRAVFEVTEHGSLDSDRCPAAITNSRLTLDCQEDQPSFESEDAGPTVPSIEK